MTLAVRLLGMNDEEALTRFFEIIAADPQAMAFFRPHPFDSAMARKICRREGIDRDDYFAVFDGEEIVGYGMLRGWDEGYASPAFGVCVKPGERGRGVGRTLLAYALERAREKGAPSVMLKVHDDNKPARALYESFGFVFSERTPDGSQLVGWRQLPEDS